MTIVNTDAPLIINIIKSSISLSVHKDFLVTLFPPCCTEWPGAMLPGGTGRVCESMLYHLSCCPRQVSFPLNSHGEPFFKCKALENDNPCLRQALVCLARTLRAFNKSFEEFHLVGRYKNSCDFQRNNC